MKIAIIGLPNSGKTTVFNALTGQTVETTAYSSGQLDPNMATVKVPDPRLAALAKLYNPRKITPTDVQYVDVGGLSGEGRTSGGLPPALLNYIQGADALLHVARAFVDDTVPHPSEKVDLARDVAEVDLELIFSDLAIIERRLVRVNAEIAKMSNKDKETRTAERDVLLKLQAALESEQPVRDVTLNEEEQKLLKGYQFLSAKPLLLVLNIGEDQIANPPQLPYNHTQSVAVAFCGKIEAELAQLDTDDAQVFMADLGISEPARDRVITASYQLLGLMSFLTAGEDEVRAWTIRRGTPAVEAASAIHSDIQRGFIRAEIVAFTDLIKAGTMVEAKKQGTVRMEGKTYTMQDGDICNFLFNVQRGMKLFLARLRATEIQLLLTVLLLFAAGYLLVVAAIRSDELVVTVKGVTEILWPSVLPFILFIGLSVGMSIYTPRADQLILPVVALLAGMGLLMTARLEPSLSRIFKGYTGIDAKQSLWVTVGVIILGGILFAPLDALFRKYQRTSFMDWLNHHRYVWLAVGVVLILATFLFGTDPDDLGVRAWFNLGIFYFQPSELLKIVLVIFMASYLDEHREVVARSYHLGPLRLPPLPYLVPMVGMWGLCMGLIIVQRDLGAALLLFCVFLSMLYVATSSGFYVLAALAAFAGGSYLMYTIVAIVKTRVTIWLDPWLTAQTTGYQLVQAVYAFASGGVFGSGLGFGYPTVVPATHTDFIFTALGEELGLVGTVGVLIAYLLLIARGLSIGLRMAGRFRGFEQLMAVGLTTILAMQTFIIVGGNLRVIPLTGITLPFMSYGGSSVLMNFLIIGLLLRISAGEEGR